MSAAENQRDLAGLRAADRHARELAVACFDRPLALEAGAGTGKTTTLVARLASWCLGVGWERAASAHPDEEPARLARRVASGVFAITFTEAAAAEMAERAAKSFGAVALRQAVTGLPDEPAGAAPSWSVRAEHLLAAVDLLEIGTIHAFCGRILRDQSLQLGLHPAFRIDADNEAVRGIARSVVAEHWPAMLDAADPSAFELARRGITAEEIATGVVEISKAGVEPEELERDHIDELKPALVQFRAACEELRKCLAGLVFGNRLKKPDVVRAALSQWLEEGREEDLVAVLEHTRSAFADSVEQVEKWSKNEIQDGVRKVGDALAIRNASRHWIAAHDAFANYDHAAFTAAANVLAPLVRAAWVRRRREGWLAFDDLLSEAAAWARSGRAGVGVWRERMTQLLVDEFQDTDTRQCDLVSALALEGPREKRPGLFVVGDPKQSIYGWRAADLAAYEGLLEKLKDEGGEVHPLSVNFRSSQAVLDEVERVLTPHLVHVPGVQAQFHPLVVPEGAADRPPPPGASAVEYWLTWNSDENGAPSDLKRPVVAQLEARSLVEDLVRQRAADPKLSWKDAAVLMRSTTDQEMVLRAMRECGVPFKVAKERSFWHHREVRDAGLVLRVILDPFDDVALVGWLRSPHVGVPDGALEPLWTELVARVRRLGSDKDEELSALGELLRRVARDFDAALPGAAASVHWHVLALEQLTRLSELRRGWNTLPLDRFMEAVRRATAAEAGESARRLGRFRVANLDAFHAEFERRARDTDGDTLELLRFLRARRDERPDADPQRPEGDAVLVSTIHSAKGLEFRLVYLIHGHKRPSANNRGRNTTAARRDGERFRFDLFGLESLHWKSVASRAKAIEEAERARLLYVALTRAAARLVIAATPKVGAAPKDQTPTSFAEHVAHRLPLDHTERFRDAHAGDDDGAADQDGVWWRFPVPSTAAVPARSADTTAAIDATHATADCTKLDRLTRDAAALRARPLVLAASSDLPGEEREPFDDGDERSATPAPRLAAAAVGTKIHALLARRATGDRRDENFASARRELATDLAGEVADAALLRFDALAKALRSGPLIARLDALVADSGTRGPYAELPILLTAGRSDTPASHFTGAADLVYEDAAGWAIVDFKTDRLASERERDERAAHYAPQLERYAVALQRALALTARPRRELWWLERGEVSIVE